MLETSPPLRQRRKKKHWGPLCNHIFVLGKHQAINNGLNNRQQSHLGTGQFPLLLLPFLRFQPASVVPFAWCLAQGNTFPVYPSALPTAFSHSPALDIELHLSMTWPRPSALVILGYLGSLGPLSQDTPSWSNESSKIGAVSEERILRSWLLSKGSAKWASAPITKRGGKHSNICADCEEKSWKIYIFIFSEGRSWVLSRSGGSVKFQQRSGDGDSRKTRTCHEAECSQEHVVKLANYYIILYNINYCYIIYIYRESQVKSHLQYVTTLILPLVLRIAALQSQGIWPSCCIILCSFCTQILPSYRVRNKDLNPLVAVKRKWELHVGCVCVLGYGYDYLG